MKRGFYKYAFAAVAASIAVGANADDAAGVMRASASNESVTVVMPFSPFPPGTPAYFLHGTEAVHGSCGQLVPGDVVICISNSGETAELKATAAAIRRNGCKVIAVTGNPDSWLARFADLTLPASVGEEGGPLDRAPRASVLVETLVLQGLSVVLQEMRGLTPQEYVLRHPGCTLGQLRENEK